MENCEVVVYVLDARDPMGSMNAELDQLLTTVGSKVIYVLNKVDLVPSDNADSWVAKFKKDKKLLVPF